MLVVQPYDRVMVSGPQPKKREVPKFPSVTSASPKRSRTAEARSAAAANEPDHQQQQMAPMVALAMAATRPHRDGCQAAATPAADEGADHTDQKIADQTDSRCLARSDWPTSRHDADQQDDSADFT